VHVSRVKWDGMEKSFDPKKIEMIFNLVSKVKENILNNALNAAMANLVKATEYYLKTPVLKKEREVLEADFFSLLQKISQHPKFAQTYGPVSFRQGEHEMNIDFMKQLIKFGAENIQQQIEQGMELLDAERLEEADKILFGVLCMPDVELEHFLIIGDAYLNRKYWDRAQKVFGLALERDPESINILNRMAISYRKDKKYKESLSLYGKAVRLSPFDEGLYYNVARLFLDMGNNKSAIQALRKALSINPKFERAAKLLVGIKQAATPAVADTDTPNCP
jgi:tetratricopeptide (TPR) repeat protein